MDSVMIEENCGGAFKNRIKAPFSLELLEILQPFKIQAYGAFRLRPLN